jgi:DNA-directed RNA polymerase specialized sigma24 family protein
MAPGHKDENGLWRACGGGDDLAWDKFVTLLYPRILKVICGICGEFGRHDVLELASEVFEELFRSRRSFCPEGDIVPYIYKIARNHCIEYRVKRTRHTEVGLDEGVINVAEQSAERRADPGKVLEATYTCLKLHIPAAPPSLKAIMEIWKEWVENTLSSSGVTPSYPTDAEIAERLGCSVDAVKSRHHEARTIIRECVKKQMEGLEEGVG